MPRKTIVTALALLFVVTLWTVCCRADSPEDDLARIQGVWERKTGHDVPGMVRATKEIHGNHEVVTYYGQDDKLIGAHEVDFEVQRFGPVKVFTFSNWVSTAGPSKGHKSPAAVSYIYRVDDNTFSEAWGFMPGQENRPPMVSMWVRRVTLTDTQQRELESLAGNWKAVEQDKGGPDATDVPGDEVTIKGDDFVSRRGGHAFLRGVIRLDPSELPKRLNIIITESPNGLSNGQTLQAVYEMDGTQLKWCSGPPAAPRPATLAPTPGGVQTLSVLRRAMDK
jgi:uncharacterized protein (TIGR03067 family)